MNIFFSKVERHLKRYFTGYILASLLLGIVVGVVGYKTTASLYKLVHGELSDSYVSGYIVEFSAAFLCFLFSTIVSKAIISRRERRKRIKQMEDGLLPTMNLLSELTSEKVLCPDTTQFLVKNITAKFSQSLLDENENDLLILDYKKISKQSCRICTKKVDVTENGKCTHCGLKTYAWDFSAKEKQEQKTEAISNLPKVICDSQ